MTVVLPRRALTAAPPASEGLIDPQGRLISYVRLSVTDRCDLRCTYCMGERPAFLPKAELLSIEEMARLADVLVRLGARRIRLTGGEPLVRRGVLDLVRHLSRHLDSGALAEVTMTTNGTLLARHAEALAAAGIKRINVSLDTLDSTRFATLTRGGRLAAVLEGIDAAQAAGLAVKINTVALRRDNAAEIPELIAWAHGRGMDLTLIETMPLGEVEDRTDQFLSLADVRADLSRRWKLTPLAKRTGGPARYVRVEETGGALGFITPLSHEFCGGCNRVRITASGRLVLCLGQEDGADLREPLRAGGDDAVAKAIREAIAHKPRSHTFSIDQLATPAVTRTMSATGG